MSALLLGASEQSARQAVSANDLPTQTDWPAYGGSPAGSRYSPLTQINLGNADNLKLAWTFDTGENQGPDGGMDIQCQPIVVRGVRALVARPGALNESLLGMSFLEKLKSYSVEGGRLVLRGK